jgi:hypothetical protein
VYDGRVLEQLAAAIEDSAVPADAPSLEEVLHLRDRLDAKISLALRAFDAEEGWKLLLQADAALDLVSPSGALFTTRPPPHHLLT